MDPPQASPHRRAFKGTKVVTNMKSDHPIRLYALQMREIKRRMEVIDNFLLAGGHAIYRPTTTEFACLQVRHILELIAFASLCANKKVYSQVHSDFAKQWNAELLLRDLARVNPDFYPIPKIERPSDDPKVKTHLHDMSDGFLTQEEFFFVYKKCGAMMHAKNPFGSKTGHHYFEKILPLWREKIIRLLSNHSVKVLGHPGFWQIHTYEAGDDEVHFYEFVPAEHLAPHSNQDV